MNRDRIDEDARQSWSMVEVGSFISNAWEAWEIVGRWYLITGPVFCYLCSRSPVHDHSWMSPTLDCNNQNVKYLFLYYLQQRNCKNIVMYSALCWRFFTLIREGMGSILARCLHRLTRCFTHCFSSPRCINCAPGNAGTMSIVALSEKALFQYSWSSHRQIKRYRCKWYY